MTLILGKTEGRRRNERRRMRWLDDITDSMEMSLSKFQAMVRDREAWYAVVHGVTNSRTRLSDFTFFLFFLSSNEYSGLISFRIDWLDLLAVQGTLKSLLQHHSSKASILWCSAFFIVQLSHLYMNTGKKKKT